MRYLSTRGGQEAGLVDAVMRGLAADGGLFVPDALPRFDPAAVRGESLAEISAEVLAPFFAGSGLEPELGAICRDAFDFPLPLKPLLADGAELSVLELFHGPTAAFKDVGARFLAALMERALRRSGDPRPLTILVATSGDTGGAVAAAFHGRRGIRVGVLFPKGQVSARQQHQLTCWGDNIRAFEVDGAFDDCQALVKAAFTDPGLQRDHRLTAANSINIGRLLPQARVSRRRKLVALAAPRHGGGLDRPERQPRQRHGLRLGAGHGISRARAGARREREPHDSRLLGHGAVAAAAERRYARIGDGRRQPEQHGAAAESRARLRASCVRASRLIPSTTRASARRSPRTMLGTVRSGARTLRRPFGSTITCRKRASRVGRGSSARRRIQRSSRASSSR